MRVRVKVKVRVRVRVRVRIRVRVRVKVRVRVSTRLGERALKDTLIRVMVGDICRLCNKKQEYE